MENYVVPNMEIVEFETEDVIRISCSFLEDNETEIIKG